MAHATPPRLEFWYELASTYSYPAALRIDALARTHGVEVEWRPFLLGPIFKGQGWSDSPFNLFAAKGRYMWRDLERVCAKHGLPLKLPPVRFPQNGVRASRVAIAGLEDGWTPAFSRAVYTANFAEQRDIEDDEVLRQALLGLGLDAAAILERSNAPECRAALRANTEEATARGIFGAPSIVVGEELFWGNDRLEDAIAWATR